MRGEPWLILPTYNEAANVEAILTAAGDVLGAAAPEGFRILVVDDGSPDGTGRLADAMAEQHEWVRVLHRTEKGGIGPAYLAGFAHALEHGAGYVMEMDSDFSHDPADLARLLAAAEGDADLALGSRYVPGRGSQGLGSSAQVHQRGRLDLRPPGPRPEGSRPDGRLQVLPQGGPRIDPLRRGSLSRICLPGRAHLPSRPGGLPRHEVPIVFRDREHGQSKMSWRIAAEAMWLVPLLRFS